MKLIGIVLIIILSRFLILLGPGWVNFSPLGALALYAGHKYLWKGWIATVITVVVSNMLVNNLLYSEYYNGWSWGIDANVVLFFVISIMGGITMESFTVLNVASAVLFFVMSNLLVWGGNMYTHDMDGMIKCYSAALPFFPNTLISQMLFGILLFKSNNIITFFEPNRKILQKV